MSNFSGPGWEELDSFRHASPPPSSPSPLYSLLRSSHPSTCRGSRFLRCPEVGGSFSLETSIARCQSNSAQDHTEDRVAKSHNIWHAHHICCSFIPQIAPFTLSTPHSWGAIRMFACNRGSRVGDLGWVRPTVRPTPMSPTWKLNPELVAGGEPPGRPPWPWGPSPAVRFEWWG